MGIYSGDPQRYKWVFWWCSIWIQVFTESRRLIIYRQQWRDSSDSALNTCCQYDLTSYSGALDSISGNRWVCCNNYWNRRLRRIGWSSFQEGKTQPTMTIAPKRGCSDISKMVIRRWASLRSWSRRAASMSATGTWILFAGCHYCLASWPRTHRADGKLQCFFEHSRWVSDCPSWAPKGCRHPTGNRGLPFLVVRQIYRFSGRCRHYTSLTSLILNFKKYQFFLNKLRFDDLMSMGAMAKLLLRPAVSFESGGCSVSFGWVSMTIGPIELFKILISGGIMESLRPFELIGMNDYFKSSRSNRDFF